MRGALLIAAAVILGAGLLAKSFDSGGPLNTGSSTGTTVHTTLPPAATTTTTVVQPHDPAQVKVLVLNGSGKTGVASTASDTLKAANYTTLEPGNAPQTETSIVYFVPGYDADAQSVAAKLGLPPSAVQPLPVPTPPTIADAKDASVIVIIGTDAPAAGATTTTAN